MALYYPFCVVALGFLFDDHFTVSKARAKPKAGSLEEFFLQNPEMDPLPAPRSRPVSEPLVTDAREDLTWAVNIVPRKASVQLDGYRKAGTFNVSLSKRDLPIDPQVVKAGQIRIFFGCADPDDFSAWVMGSMNGKPTRVLRTHDDAGVPDPNLLALWGVFDEVSMSLDGSHDEISFEGRDLRGVLLDSPIDAKKFTRLKLDQPIDKVVQDILSTHPLADKMNITVQPTDWESYGLPPGAAGPPRPIPSPVTTTGVTRVNAGLKGNTPGAQPTAANSKLTYWDLVTQFCFLVGAIPYFRGHDLCIRPVAALESLKGVQDLETGAVTFDPKVKTPFAGGKTRQLPGGQPFAVRRLVYGRNVQKLTIKRRLAGGMRPKVIQVVSLDTRTHKILEATWPKDLKKKTGGAKGKGTTANPSGGAGATEVHRVPLSGITDIGQLTEIAKAIFESTAHHEVEGTFATKELASLIAPGSPGDARTWGNADADLLRCRPGDPVQVLMDGAHLGSRQRGQDSFISSVTQDESLGFDEAVEQVSKRLTIHDNEGRPIQDRNFARVLVATGRNAVLELQQWYRIHGMDFAWNCSGDKASMEVNGKFHNYIEAQYGEPGVKPGTKQPLQRISVSASTDPETAKIANDGDEGLF